MKKFFTVLIFFMCAITLIAEQTLSYDLGIPTENKEAGEAYKLGTEYFNTENYEKAENEFKKVLQLDPNCVAAANFLGLTYYRQYKKVPAIQTFEKALKDAKRLKQNKLLTLIHLNLAEAYQANGMIDSAIDEYNHVINEEPGNPEGYYGLGILLYNTKREIYAVDYLKTAYNLYRKAQSAYAIQTLYYIASSYYKIGDYNSAKIYFAGFKDPSILKEFGISQQEMDILKTAEKKERELLKNAKFKFKKYGLKVKNTSYLKEIKPPKKYPVSIEKAFEIKDGSARIYYAFAEERKALDFDSVYAFIHQTARNVSGNSDPAWYEIFNSTILFDNPMNKQLGAAIQLFDSVGEPDSKNLEGYKYVLVRGMYQRENGIIFQIILYNDDFAPNKYPDLYVLCRF